MNRKQRAKLAQETVKILELGRYRVGDEWLYIKDDIEKSVQGTVSYPTEKEIPPYQSSDCKTEFFVENESTLAGAKRMAEHNPAVLNFASAKNPGGGFLGGSQAQEESLARSSALYAALTANMEMYEFHRQQKDPMYSDWVKYSPNVPVFRNDEGALLAESFSVSFVTCPAVNAGVVLDRDKTRGKEISEIMARRAARFLSIMAAHGHKHLVLGAWGCGVFRNKPDDVANMFHSLLTNEFAGVFEQVLFSIYDSKKGQPALSAFQAVFQ